VTTRAVACAAACALTLSLASCGSQSKPAAGGPNPNDKRAVALGCLQNQQLPARLTGQKSIQVDGTGGPRVEFLLSSGEAEGRQFQGDAQGAEQIGSALLFVNQGSEDQLKKIETCLENQ
jgi:hypothetical protein